jgi:hypothetical protein
MRVTNELAMKVRLKRVNKSWGMRAGGGEEIARSRSCEGSEAFDERHAFAASANVDIWKGLSSELREPDRGEKLDQLPENDCGGRSSHRADRFPPDLLNQHSVPAQATAHTVA